MAGIFGEQINSREDFFEQLSSAVQTCADLHARHPEEDLLEVVAKQLEQMRLWSADGRAPTKVERRRIVIGFQMAREYDTTPYDDLRDFTGRIGALSNYFVFWPDDKTTADPDNDDYLFLQDVLYDDESESS